MRMMGAVSVPLRGYGFEILFWILSIMRAVGTIVSVPLRGYGFEIMIIALLPISSGRFRPLAGIWF